MDLKIFASVISIIIGMGIIASGTVYVLDALYVPRSELVAFQKSNQETNTEMLDKLTTLEGSVLTLTSIFLKGEITSLNRTIDSLEAIENKTETEVDYLRRLKDDRESLQGQLESL